MDQSVNIKINTLSGQAMHTREKIGPLCKRVLCYVLENKKGVKAFKETVSAINGDNKKVIDILFAFEGIGFITRVTKNKFVYTGFRGLIQRIIEFVRFRLRKHKRYNNQFDLLTEDLYIGGKPYSVKSSISFSKFLSSVICTLLLDSNKTITRNEVEVLFEEAVAHLKEQSSKNSMNDALSILFALNLVEKNESNDNMTWIGPDCINTAGVTLDSAADLDNFENLLKPKNVNFDAKELQFYKVLLKEEISTNKFLLKAELFSKDVHAESMVKDPNSNLNLYHFSNFEPGGYALLKGKDWQHIMTKPYAIIGRATSKDGTRPKKSKWEVDVDLSKNSSVSRQHAVILYNFEEETFEIKCLSKKNPVKVGNYSYDFKDKPCPLISKTHIVLGGESFYFYLPNLPREKKDEPINEEFEEKKEEGEGDDLKLEEGEDSRQNLIEDEIIKKEGSDGEEGDGDNDVERDGDGDVDGDGDGDDGDGDGDEDVEAKIEDEELSQE